MIRRFLFILLITNALVAVADDFADRLSNRTNVVLSQPEALRARLANAKAVTGTPDGADGEAATATAAPSRSAGGYRVQVFSDNNPRTAKNEAHSKAAAIGEAFPQWATYITYDSPYWRLRVGDFRTYDDATRAVVELKNAFPAYRRELRVVRDRIKVTD